MNELQSIGISSLEITSGQFVVIVSNETSGAVKAASKSKGSFFKDINDLVIVRQHQSQNDIFSIYKKVNDKVVINNIWKNGKLIGNNSIFEKNLKPNFHGKLLKCTSFETAPMIYKTYKGAETFDGGYEVNENS